MIYSNDNAQIPFLIRLTQGTNLDFGFSGHWLKIRNSAIDYLINIRVGEGETSNKLTKNNVKESIEKKQELGIYKESKIAYTQFQQTIIMIVKSN